MIERALSEVDAIAAEARRLSNADNHSIHMGVSPVINPQLVARAYSAMNELPSPRDLVLREANLRELRDGLTAGELDVILVPSVQNFAAFEQRILDSEPVVVVDSDMVENDPIEFLDVADDQFILVPDACGLRTFTTQLFDSHDAQLNAYPGEAASYQLLEQWAKLGLGSALLPLSKLSSPDAPHRRLYQDGAEVEISYEAVWHPGGSRASDIDLLTRRLAGGTTVPT